MAILACSSAGAVWCFCTHLGGFARTTVYRATGNTRFREDFAAILSGRSEPGGVFSDFSRIFPVNYDSAVKTACCSQADGAHLSGFRSWAVVVPACPPARLPAQRVAAADRQVRALPSRVWGCALTAPAASPHFPNSSLLPCVCTCRAATHPHMCVPVGGPDRD